MSRLSRLLGAVYGAWLVVSGGQACSPEKSEAPSVRPPSTGSGGSAGEAEATPVTPPVPNPNMDGGATWEDPLCGTSAGRCIPDDGYCRAEASAGGDTGGPEAGSGALLDTACRVLPSADGPRSACALPGGGELDAPCFSTDDCGPGLACIGEGVVGRCRPFCCRGEASCDALAGTYCTERPQRENGSGGAEGGESLVVPVCMPADDCDLGEPYPCPASRQCDCPGDTMCVVVRADGTTACRKPSPEDGEAGDPCPCAWGYVCSQASNTCLKICSTVDDGSACPGQRCQASAQLPPGFGVCIGS